jgi:hypothetical protein
MSRVEAIQTERGQLHQQRQGMLAQFPREKDNMNTVLKEVVLNHRTDTYSLMRVADLYGIDLNRRHPFEGHIPSDEQAGKRDSRRPDHRHWSLPAHKTVCLDNIRRSDCCGIRTHTSDEGINTRFEMAMHSSHITSPLSHPPTERDPIDVTDRSSQ